jgi:hypothetical protein
MNKYEQLIEHIINDEEGKARALFHEIVVEKSRDIYESLMDEEYTEEGIGGDQVGGLVDEITMDETDGIGEGDDMDSMDGMDDMSDMADMGDMDSEEDLESKVIVSAVYVCNLIASKPAFAAASTILKTRFKEPL